MSYVFVLNIVQKDNTAQVFIYIYNNAALSIYITEDEIRSAIVPDYV